MRSTAISLLATAALLPGQTDNAATDRSAPDRSGPVPLQVAVFAAKGAERGDGITARLRQLGMKVRRIAPKDCQPESFWNVDVVVVDWPKDHKLEARHHGAFLRWHRPTLFFAGSAARFANAWHLPTAAQIEAMPAALRGPAMHRLERADLCDKSVWRHGNFFHLPKLTTDLFADQPFAAFVDTLRFASRFVVDRPVVRFSPPQDVARRDRVTALADKLEVDLSDKEQLRALPSKLRTKDEADARELLAHCLEGGPEASTTLNNWHNWMRGRLPAMHWDHLSKIWRIDELAHWRGTPTADLRAEARAEPESNDPKALAIAHKTAQFYGGRALADLQTFSCWHGELCYLWDRRRGYFRVECHVTKFARATPWKATAMDTFTDKQLIWGNGDKPRGPRISARGMYREMMLRTFLPLVLLEPGVRLRYLEAESTKDEAVLEVHIAGRCLDLKTSYAVTVSRATGELVRFRALTPGRFHQVFELVETTPCGPLTLPTKWRVRTGRREREYGYEDVRWNPKLPMGMESVKERLTEARAK